MAEAYLKKLYGDHYEVYSAGTHLTKVNPFVVEVMREEGIDLSKAYSNNLEDFLEEEFDLAITLCDDAKENCSVFPAGEMGHHGFPDPSKLSGSREEILAGTRKIRDMIKKWIQTRFSP